MAWLDHPPRFLFFTGKGGVGKTALSCATALHLADAGKRLLLVSTDPASNLDQMLGTPLTNHPTPIPGAPGLFAMNIDPEMAADDYRERVISPYRTLWDSEQIAKLHEQLAGACTTEIAAFDEFAGLLAGDDEARGRDHIIFDTAPTGHTLRLLSLPKAWTGFLEDSPHSESCLGPHAGLKMQHDRFAAALAALTDPDRTTVVLVTRPDVAALREAARTSGELRELGLQHQQLVINAVFEARDRTDRVAVALEQRGAEALAAMPDALRTLPAERVPLRPFNMVGLVALRALLGGGEVPAAATRRSIPQLPSLSTLFDDLAAPGKGLVMVMGKGGVGKTTIAATVALELASRGFPVHLSTTDPAAHLASTLAGHVPNLTVSRIDPEAETKAYVDNVMKTRGAKLDDAGRALLAEDLRSPCYEEVAVFGAFSRLVREAQRGFVVLDTAPTGHTLLLLDATGAYHKEIVRAYKAEHAGRITTPLMRLADPAFTKILLVALAETTPVSEAAQLQADLRRANIEPFAWVINSSLAAAGSSDPILQQRIAGELEQIELVQREHAKRVAIVPWQTEAPVGIDRLRRLAGAPERDAQGVQPAASASP